MANHDRVKILIVDDLPEKLVVYEAILRDLNQELVMVRSGQDALRAVLKDEFAVILLDVNMPGMDGFETANLIRSRKRSAHTPIIFVTAFNDEPRIAEGYSRGAVDFITTPIVPTILRAKVRVFVDLFRMTQKAREHAEQRIALAEERIGRANAEEANRRLSFLVKAGAIITRTLDGAVIIKSLLRLLVPDLIDRAAIALIGQEDWAITSASARDGRVEIVESEGTADFPPRWQSALRQVREAAIADGAAIHGCGTIEDRFVCLPLRERDRVFGALVAETSGERPLLSPADVQVLESITSRSAAALTNARLFQEVEFANDQKNRFLSMLAHELRNPLAPIQSAVDLMRLPGVDREDLQSARDVIERQVSHLVRLVDDLLDVSRITLGKIRLSRRCMDARDVVAAAVEISQPLIEERGHALDVSAPRASLPIHGDAARLAQVLSNLLNNAAKFTSPGGEISLSLFEEANEAVFRVRDSGIGIPPSMLPKVFDLFTQVDSSIDRSHGGLGVGLTLVRELVGLHGGKVEVSSPGPGQGSEFSVRIPLAGNFTPVSDSAEDLSGAIASA